MVVQKLSLQAPAKINLYLKITGRRPDGYHELNTLMQKIALFDELELDLQTAPEVDVPMKTEEVVAVAREVIESQMGLQLSKIQVNIEHVPYRPPL